MRSLLCIMFSESPGPPLNSVAVEIENTHNTSGCIISMDWKPPLGYSEADVDHYIVDIPSRESRVTFESFVAFFLHIHECNENISVKLRAVNRCGHIGTYTQDIKPTLLNQQRVMDEPTGKT